MPVSNVLTAIASVSTYYKNNYNTYMYMYIPPSFDVLPPPHVVGVAFFEEQSELARPGSVLTTTLQTAGPSSCDIRPVE